MRNYEQLQKAGNRAALEKLQQNEHKSGFDDIDIHYAFKRVTDEAVELNKELFCKVEGTEYITRIPYDKIDYSKVRHEAADIRNFCDMIILKCDMELSK